MLITKVYAVMHSRMSMIVASYDWLKAPSSSLTHATKAVSERESRPRSRNVCAEIILNSQTPPCGDDFLRCVLLRWTARHNHAVKGKRNCFQTCMTCRLWGSSSCSRTSPVVISNRNQRPQITKDQQEKGRSWHGNKLDKLEYSVG